MFLWTCYKSQINVHGRKSNRVGYGSLIYVHISISIGYRRFSQVTSHHSKVTCHIVQFSNVHRLQVIVHGLILISRMLYSSHHMLYSSLVILYRSHLQVTCYSSQVTGYNSHVILYRSQIFTVTCYNSQVNINWSRLQFTSHMSRFISNRLMSMVTNSREFVAGYCNNITGNKSTRSQIQDNWSQVLG